MFESIFSEEDGDRKKQLEHITGEISKTEDSFVKLGRLYVEGKVDDTDYKNLKTSYRDEVAKLRLEKEEYRWIFLNRLKGWSLLFLY